MGFKAFVGIWRLFENKIHFLQLNEFSIVQPVQPYQIMPVGLISEIVVPRLFQFIPQITVLFLAAYRLCRCLISAQNDLLV